MIKIAKILALLTFVITSTSFTAFAADQKAKKSKKQKVEYIGSTGVPKADPDVFLSLNGGIFTLNDKSSPSYAVSWQAYDRLPIKFDGKKGYVITVKSGAEVNMSEELYQHLVKYFEQSNEYLKRY